MSNERSESSPSLITRFTAAVISRAARLICRLWLGLEVEEDPKVTGWKRSEKGFMILCAHPSEMDAVVLLAACKGRYSRFVVGAQQLYKGLQGRLLRMMDVIPKRQFTPDPGALRQMIRTVRGGQVLCMMPEGRVSADGTPCPIDPATGKLIKKLGCPVAVLVPEGTYFVKPSYNYTGVIAGKISGRLTALFDEGEAPSLSEEDIMDRLVKALDYNAFEQIKRSGSTYGKRENAMAGVSNLLYYCPACGSLCSIEEKPNLLYCSDCGMSVGLSESMIFDVPEEYRGGVPDNIAAWNRLQLAKEQLYWQSEEAEPLVFKVCKETMTIGKDGDFSPAGEGFLLLGRDGLHYGGEEETLDIPLAGLFGVSADYKYGFIAVYQEDTIMRFYFTDRRYPMLFVNSLMALKGFSGPKTGMRSAAPDQGNETIV